jgi:hypothetical protein
MVKPRPQPSQPGLKSAPPTGQAAQAPLPSLPAHLAGYTPEHQAKAAQLADEEARLRSTDAAEKARVARLLEIDAEKAQVEAENQEALRQQEFQILSAEFEAAKAASYGARDRLLAELTKLIENYQAEVGPAAQKAVRLQSKISQLMGPTRTPVLLSVPQRADDWLSYLHRRGTLTEISRTAQRAQQAAEEAKRVKEEQAANSQAPLFKKAKGWSK